MIWQTSAGAVIWRSCVDGASGITGVSAARWTRRDPHRADIAERPAIVAAKSRLGDWEGDTLVGTRHQGRLLTHGSAKACSRSSRNCLGPRLRLRIVPPYIA